MKDTEAASGDAAAVDPKEVEEEVEVLIKGK